MDRVSDVMTKSVDRAAREDRLSRVAHVLWEKDCGVVPVVDGDGRPVGMVTDRDACMAAFLRGRPLHAITVDEVLAERGVVAIAADASLDEAHEAMRAHQVRRLPVVDADGLLVGIVSLADLVQVPGGKAAAAARRKRFEAVGATFAAVVRPHAASVRGPDGTEGARADVVADAPARPAADVARRETPKPAADASARRETSKPRGGKGAAAGKGRKASEAAD